MDKKKKTYRPWHPSDLQKKIIQYTSSSKDVATFGDLCEGTLVLGETGAGKSSALKTFAMALMEQKFGWFGLTVKPDDVEDQLSWAYNAGRLADVSIIGPNPTVWKRYLAGKINEPDRDVTDRITIKDKTLYIRHSTLNFLAAEMDGGTGMDSVESLENVVITVMKAVESSQLKSGGGGDPTWTRAAAQLLRSLLTIAWEYSRATSARPELNLALVSDIMKSLPGDAKMARAIMHYTQHADELKTLQAANEKARNNPNLKPVELPDFGETFPKILKYFAEHSSRSNVIRGRLAEVTKKLNSEGLSAAESIALQKEEASLKTDLATSGDKNMSVSLEYILKEFPSYAPATNTSILFSLSNTIDMLRRDPLSTMMCCKSTISATALRDGAIIISGLCVKQYREIAQTAGVLLKRTIQRVLERCCYGQGVVIWVDEFQNYLAPDSDKDFQSTARSARCCSVFMSQNWPLLASSMGGGGKGDQEIAALAGNLLNKLYFRNTCRETNAIASDTLGKSYRTIRSQSQSSNDSGPGGSTTRSENHQIEHHLLPVAFTKLRSGGADNKLCVDAYLFRSGRRFSNGKNYRKITFHQGHMGRLKKPFAMTKRFLIKAIWKTDYVRPAMPSDSTKRMLADLTARLSGFDLIERFLHRCRGERYVRYSRINATAGTLIKRLCLRLTKLDSYY